MIEAAYDFREFNNAILPQLMDYVSADISDGSVLQATNSGRDGSGGVTFTPCTDATGGNYDLAAGKTYTSQSTRIVQMNVEQTAAQDTLGGRLITFLDATEDVFGATVQVAINIMADNKLKAFRANAQGTGFVLRNVDQAGDSQMTLLGTSSGVLDSDGYLEIEVVHHPTAGSITVWLDNVEFWSLTNVNTAISGASHSSTVYWGGYGVVETGSDTLHHEDLAAIISDVMVINTVVNPDDPNDPTQRIGDHKPVLSTPTADSNYTEYIPDPAGSHFANVDEIPPDSGTTQNSATEIALRDNFGMTDAAGTGSNAVYLAYNEFVRVDTPAECGVSDAPANFEAFIFTEQLMAGEVQSVIISDDVCDVGVLGMGHRAQSVCTISQDGEAVTFTTPTISQTDRFFVFLTPLNAPPRLQVKVQNVPGLFGPCVFNSTQNVLLPATGEVRYSQPWERPWAGYAVDTQEELSTTADYFEFKLSGEGIGTDVGLVDHNYNVALDPYSPSVAALHFRQDLPGLPFFYIGTNFTYNGETTYSYTGTDTFRLTRTATEVEVRQNGILLETITPGVMPADLLPYVLLGRWGYDGSTYSVRPGIRDAVAATAGIACTVSYYFYSCTVPGVGPSGATTDMEVSQWGLVFDTFDFGVTGFAIVVDPSNPSGPVPQVQYDASTVFTFRLSGGNVLIEVTGYLFIEGFVEVAGTGTYTYSRPYADTDDFFLQPPFDIVPVGVQPVFGGPDSFEFDFTPAVASAPLRLGFIVNLDDDTFPDRPQLNNVSFTFIEGQNPTVIGGFMRQDSVDRDGTPATAPTEEFRYVQSFLASTPTDTPITLDDANISSHGYVDPE